VARSPTIYHRKRSSFVSIRGKWSKQLGLNVLALVAGAALLTQPGTRGEEQAQAERIKIGLAKSLFKDVPDGVLALMSQPFNTLMQTQTGMTGVLVKGGDFNDLGKKLVNEEVQLGIFLGIEYAWARTKYPDLKPVMIAINEQRHLRAYMVVREDSGLTCFADLKGQEICVPRGSKEHCTLFLDRCCREASGNAPGEPLSKRTAAPTSEDALDDVVDKVAPACVIDGVALNLFKKRKPGRFAQLKTVAESEIFPAAVVAYHPGALSPATLQRFQDGMKEATKTTLGRQLLTLWKLSDFELVPDDYEQICTDIVKCYPPPVAK
jgi:ABC-type phosphate/phosphonate transport system substrate-binding protein